MILDKINLNHVRLFEVVYRTKSMTIAAQQLHLTQSGVSQHIKTLEEALGVKLFDRIKQRLVATDTANQLFQHSQQGLSTIEKALLEVTGRQNEFTGTVAFGIPLEFGNDVVLPLISALKKKYPKIKFRIEVGLANIMNEKLLRGELDFAFIDSFTVDKRLDTVQVFNESLELCANSDSFRKLNPSKYNREYFESLNYVGYNENASLVRMWLSHHMKLKNVKINLIATVMDAYTISNLVKNGVGVGVLPGYMLSKLQKDGYKVYAFKGNKPLFNTISIASIKERSLSQSSQFVFDYLKTKIANK